jgi:hypothetical protein
MTDEAKEKFILEKLNEPCEYENCYVAFLDMLGFKALCGKKKMNCSEIKTIFDELESLKTNFYNGFSTLLVSDKVKQKTNFTVMSDSIVISAPAVGVGLSFIIYLCSSIQYMLLRKGITLRGGIAKGEFFYSANITYGPALIEAYKIESEVANYPRVVISDEITEILEENGFFKYNSTIHDMIKQSTDDSLYFVHYLNLFDAINNGEQSLKEIENTIQCGFSNTNAHIKTKYKWLKEYYERSFQNPIQLKEQTNG